MSAPVFCARALSVLVIAAAASTQLWAAPGNQERRPTRSGREVFESTCMACHGPDGRGTVNPTLTKVVALPDFSDCNFAAREPDADWVAVAHNGGPARGFSALMPPWAGMFTAEELTLAVNHLRTFCTDERWPRGELNLPRPLVTEKAFPEDEIVVSTSATSRDEGEVVTKFIYERRFGRANQVEVAVPFASLESNSGSWASGVGDVAVGYKRTLFHSLRQGNIFSLSAEVVLPTGSEQRGLGKGFAIFEPFVTFGQLLPGDSFVQAHAGLEIPGAREEDDEAFWRGAFGRSFQQGKFGRTWSPMLEVLGARSLTTGATTHWDLVPQVQITLNARQHLRVNGGVRVPVNDRRERSPTVIFYFLWDWFDGGLFEGW